MLYEKVDFHNLSHELVGTQIALACYVTSKVFTRLINMVNYYLDVNSYWTTAIHFSHLLILDSFDQQCFHGALPFLIISQDAANMFLQHIPVLNCQYQC